MTNLPLKNYTSSVPVHQTIADIERLIAQAGATRVQKEFGPSAHVTALMFTISTRDGKPFTIRLPADVQPIFVELWKTIRRPRPETEKRILEQAERTAWRLMRDWTLVQFSLIKLQQREPLEVFLPFVWDASRHQTYFQILDQGKFKALPSSDASTS